MDYTHQSKWSSSIKSTNNKFWRGYGEKEILLHCLWESKLIQPLCRTVRRFLKKLWIELPCVCACSVMSDSLQPHGLQPARLLCPWDSPGKNTGLDCHSLLQRIFPTQGWNSHLLGVLHSTQILYPWATIEDHAPIYLALINDLSHKICFQNV